jgi:hypothetical protein
MPARRILLIAGITAILGAALSPAQATVGVPETYGVSFQVEDEFGNRLEGQARWTRISDPNSQLDRYIITCEVHAMPGQSVFPDVSTGAAVAINPSVPGNPQATDGCYLILDDVPVFNASGIGASGDEVATSSLRNLGDKYWEYDGSGDVEACISARGLFTNGGFAEVKSICGNQSMEL